MTRFALASSPLVGAGALEPLADALRRLGHAVQLPDAPAELDAHGSIFAGLAPDATLVAYSAAGPRAELLADAARSSAIVYLDARLPIDGAAPDDDEQLRGLLDQLPLDDAGRMPPWTEWWPEETLATLVPDTDRRAVLAASCPRVARAVMSTPVSAPGFDGACGYVVLSEPYRSAARAADDAGWPVVDVAGATHLSPFVEPEVVASALLAVTERLA